MRAKISLILAASAMLAGTPAFAASDYLLELEGVKGEATTKIEVASWSFGVCNAGQCSTVKSPRDAASGLATGKRQHGTVRVQASQNTQSLRTAPQSPAPAGTAAVSETIQDESKAPPRASWDLATNKAGRTAAGGVHVAAGDLDGDGRADLAYAGTQDEVSAFTLIYDKASPVLAKVCMGKHIASATLSRGTESYTLSHATVSCTGTGPVTMVLSGGQMKHTKTGHVTLLK